MFNCRPGKVFKFVFVKNANYFSKERWPIAHAQINEACQHVRFLDAQVQIQSKTSWRNSDFYWKQGDNIKDYENVGTNENKVSFGLWTMKEDFKRLQNESLFKHLQLSTNLTQLWHILKEV